MNKNKIWHILPENDARPHAIISEIESIVDNDGNIGEMVKCECTCEPTIIYEEDKILIVHEAFDRPSAYFKSEPQGKKDSIIEEKQIGVLGRQWGLKGFIPALPGHPVFTDGNRYFIYLQPEKAGEIIKVPFIKDTLKPYIDFF